MSDVPEGTDVPSTAPRILVYAPEVPSLDGHRPSISWQRTKMNQRGEEPFTMLANHYLQENPLLYAHHPGRVATHSL